MPLPHCICYKRQRVTTLDAGSCPGHCVHVIAGAESPLPADDDVDTLIVDNAPRSHGHRGPGRVPDDLSGLSNLVCVELLHVDQHMCDQLAKADCPMWHLPRLRELTVVGLPPTEPTLTLPTEWSGENGGPRLHRLTLHRLRLLDLTRLPEPTHRDVFPQPLCTLPWSAESRPAAVGDGLDPYVCRGLVSGHVTVALGFVRTGSQPRVRTAADQGWDSCVHGPWNRNLQDPPLPPRVFLRIDVTATGGNGPEAAWMTDVVETVARRVVELDVQRLTPAWLQAFVKQPLIMLRTLHVCHMQGAEIATMLSAITAESLPVLEGLGLMEADVPMLHVPRLSSLKCLELLNCRRVAWFTVLALPSLTSLRVEDCGLTEWDLASLKKLDLVDLEVGDCPVYGGGPAVRRAPEPPGRRS